MPELKRLTILLVEDEEELRRETAAFLELYYDTIIQAAEGAEALELFAVSRRPQLTMFTSRPNLFRA